MKVKPPETLHEFATGTRKDDPLSRWRWFRLNYLAVAIRPHGGGVLCLLVCVPRLAPR